MERGPLLLLAAFAALACVALGAWLMHRLRGLRESSRGRAHNQRGQRGERDAERLLAAHGYTLLARQTKTRYPVEVDAESVEVMLQADYLVSRAGKRLVAEVKTGRHAPRFQHAETRRQLLEYQLAFAVDSVLLVDVEAATLREVRFPLPGRTRRSSAKDWLLVIVLLGLCSYWFAHP